MKEIRNIVEAYNNMDRGSIKAALATVVNVEGSSYRRTGARMLIMDNGKWVGGISGGCLEGDALKRARLSIIKSIATLTTYDTTEDDPYQIGVGLGCNGIIDVLITPIKFDDAYNPVEVLKSCLISGRQNNAVISVTAIKGLWKTIEPGYTFRYTGSQSLTIFDNKELESQLLEKLQNQAIDQKSVLAKFELLDGRAISLFLEVIKPEIQVVLMGHQYDIYSMAMIARDIGWRVAIVSNSAKISGPVSLLADQVLNTDQLNDTKIDEHSAIVLMSHDYKTDKLNLAKVMPTCCRYIGMLGPRVRAEKIFRELAEDGITISEKDQERIFAPAGLDIGATSPEEIALSIAAEIGAVFENRTGGYLRHRQSPIHERHRV